MRALNEREVVEGLAKLRAQRRALETRLAKLKREEGQLVRAGLAFGLTWNRLATVTGYTRRGLMLRHGDRPSVSTRGGGPAGKRSAAGPRLERAAAATVSRAVADLHVAPELGHHPDSQQLMRDAINQARGAGQGT